jgi:predicted dehydrogenase
MHMTFIAHVGYGYWGRNIARNFAELGALAAVVDPHVPSAEEAAKNYGVRALTFDQALADTTISGVSLASPAELHYALARKALEAGKHVFVEKPLALRVNEAEELCRMADERQLVLMVGHLLQYHPVYIKLREMVQAGDLGKIQYIYSNRLSLGKFRTEENVLWSFAPHDISMVLGLFDEEPHKVTAQGHVAYSPGIADMVTTQMKFPKGGSAHVQVSWMHPFKEQRLVVIGDRAMAVFEDSAADWGDKLTVYDHVIDTSGAVPLPKKAEGRAIAVDKGEPLKAECQHFLDAIVNGREPRTGGAEGLRVLKVLDRVETALAANLSA